MAIYERPVNSFLTEFDEGVTAAVWGIDDPVDAIPPHIGMELGILSSEPLQRRVSTRSGEKFTYEVLGSRTMPDTVGIAYLQTKRDLDLI